MEDGRWKKKLKRQIAGLAFEQIPTQLGADGFMPSCRT
jgi:hypothetical protein